MSKREWSVEVDRPADEVLAWWVDFAFQLPRLRGATLGIRKASPGPTVLGSTFQQRVAVLGFESTMNARISDWDPPYAATISLEGGIARSGTIRLRIVPTATGSRIVRTLEIEPQGIARLLWPILWPALIRRADVANRNIKRLIESEHP